MIKIKKGFSLIELLFSIAIISTVIVMVCIFYSYMMKVSTKGVDISIASQLAEAKLNELTNDKRISSDSSLKTLRQLFQENSFASFVKTGVEKIGTAKYYYVVKVSPVTKAGTFSRAGHRLMGLYFADVFVFWWADDVTASGEGETAGSTVSTDNNIALLRTIESRFKSSEDYLTDDKIIENFGTGKSTNLNEGYKFVRLSRIVSKPQD